MRRYTQLRLEERMRIAELWQAKFSITEIAKALGRSPSTIFRELRRNQAPPGQYWPDTAHNLAFKRKQRTCLLDRNKELQVYTLLKHLLPEYNFVTFDQNQDMYNARSDPDLFLSNFPSPLILDEIQFIPELLPAIKRHVDLSNASGQYILTGSQNLIMMKHVTESLAGRVGILELFPLTYFELCHQTSWLEAYTESRMECIQPSQHPQPLAELIWRGGLPGLFRKDNDIVTDYHLSYVRTYVERDVRLSENIQNMGDFDRFTRLTASLTGQEINQTQLGRDIGITHTTAQRWLNILKQNYQWMEVDPYWGNITKRLSRKSKGYCVDSGLACTLQGIGSPRALMSHPSLGALFETYCVNMIVSWLSSYRRSAHVYHWRTSNQAEVDLVIDLDGILYPIEIKCKSHVSNRDASGLRAFLATYAHQRVAPAIILYAGNEVMKIDANIWAIPFHSMSR